MPKTQPLLLRKADATKQVSEARVASQGIEPGIHPDRGQSIRTVEIGSVEPGKGFYFISKDSIRASHVEPADVTFASLILNAGEHRASLVLPASQSVGSRILGQDNGFFCGFHAAIGRSQRLFTLAKFRIGEGQDVVVMPDPKGGFNGLLVASYHEQQPCLVAVG